MIEFHRSARFLLVRQGSGGAVTLYQCVCNPTTSKNNPTVNISSSVPVIIKIIKTKIKEAVGFLELQSIKIKE